MPQIPATQPVTSCVPEAVKKHKAKIYLATTPSLVKMIASIQMILFLSFRIPKFFMQISELSLRTK
jgi:hypothetical protein